MADLNRVSLIGRLTRDAEVRYAPNGMGIASFSIAVNRNVKQNDVWNEIPSFFDITYFSKGAENFAKYLLKGQQVGVDGELRQDVWDKDGQRHSKVVVIAQSVQLLGGQRQNSVNQSEVPAHSASRPRSESPQYQADSESNTFDDDVPF